MGVCQVENRSTRRRFEEAVHRERQGEGEGEGQAGQMDYGVGEGEGGPSVVRQRVPLKGG